MTRDEIEKLIESYANLSEGWDGYNGIPANAQTVSDAKKLLSLIPEGVPLPTPGISGDGEISFFWNDKKDVFIDLGAYGSGGTYCYYAKLKDSRFYGDELKISDGLEPQFLWILEKASEVGDWSSDLHIVSCAEFRKRRPRSQSFKENSNE